MRLPIEVLEAVVDQASDNFRTLQGLSLTCATLLPRSRHHLFRNIVIQTGEQLWSSCEFLDSRPWLISLVRKITLKSIKYSRDHPKLHIGLLDAAPVHVLNRLPKLHVWEMQASTNIWLSLHRFTLRSYRQYGDHIRCLELHNTNFDRISDFKGLVSAFTRIECLSCYGIKFNPTKYERSGDSLVTAGINIRPLPISTLRISTSVNSEAIEYLLSRSGSKVKNLTLELRATDCELDSHLEKIERSMMWLTGLSSLVLVLDPDNNLNRAPSGATSFSRTLLSATKIFEQVYRRFLKDVRVEFLSDPVADLAVHLSRNSAACKDLEAALLTFPKAPVLVRDPVHWRRAGRAKLWSPTIRRAFQKLNDRGLLTFKFTPSKEFSPDPVGHEHGVVSIVVLPDSTLVVTASWEGIIIVWDMASQTVLREWLAHEGGSPFALLAVSPDGRQLVSSDGYTLAVWDIDGSNSSQKVAEFQRHTDMVTACAWSPDGALIASGSRDGTVRIWSDGKIHHQNDPLGPPTSYDLMSPPSLEFSSDGHYLAWISGGENQCWVWTRLADKPSSGKTLRSHPDRRNIRITAFSFDHDSRRIATAHGTFDEDPDPDACVVRIWDAATGAPLTILTGHSERLLNVRFSSDGRSLLSVSQDMDVRVWDCGTWSGEHAGVFGETASLASSWTTCFSHDGRYMATQSSTATVQVWRTGDASCVATFGEHDSHVTRIAFSPNGQFLVYGDLEGIVHIHGLSECIDE